MYLNIVVSFVRKCSECRRHRKVCWHNGQHSILSQVCPESLPGTPHRALGAHRVEQSSTHPGAPQDQDGFADEPEVTQQLRQHQAVILILGDEGAEIIRFWAHQGQAWGKKSLGPAKVRAGWRE